MKYRKYERERAEMLKIDEKTALLDEYACTVLGRVGRGVNKFKKEGVSN